MLVPKKIPWFVSLCKKVASPWTAVCSSFRNKHSSAETKHPSARRILHFCEAPETNQNQSVCGCWRRTLGSSLGSSNKGHQRTWSQTNYPVFERMCHREKSSFWCSWNVLVTRLPAACRLSNRIPATASRFTHRLVDKQFRVTIVSFIVRR